MQLYCMTMFNGYMNVFTSTSRQSDLRCVVSDLNAQGWDGLPTVTH